jgi:tight adherence protein B
MKRLLLAALGATAIAVPAAASAAGGGTVQLTEARGAKFPERAFVIQLPTNRALTAESVAVTENGGGVADVTLIPASQVGRKTFGVVVVVDTSDSMKGAPVRSAMDAVRAFAARRNANQQFALVTFNGSPKVVLPFTTSADRIDAAIATVPAVSYGTHIYDAVARAERMLLARKVEAGSILVLSDGADTGSTASASDVLAAARADNIKIFSVGLHSPHFDPTSLDSLAAGGGGEYALAQSTKELAPLFDQLGERLSQQYVLRYKSLAGPKTTVHVRVDVTGLGVASSAYETPALDIPTVPPYHRSVADRVWGSVAIIVVLALLGALAAGLLALSFFEHQSSGLPARMAEFVSVPGLQSRGRRGSGGVLPETEAKTTAPNALDRLDKALEIAQIPIGGAALIVWTAVGSGLTYLILLAATSSPWWALFAVLVPLAVREFVIRKLASRRNQFSEQLPDTLQVISSALRSGHSLAGALAVVVESSAEPMKSEMQRVVADEQRGIPLDDALAVVSERMASRDLEQVALVAELQRSAGSNAAEVVDRVAETVRERFELRRLIKTLTVQGRMSRWIVSALPVAIILILQVINPHYMDPLFAHLAGRIVFGLAVALCIAGSLVIKKIVDIKV